jgi:hypothetical protein
VNEHYDLVVLATFSQLHQAEIVVATLDAHDVDAIVVNNTGISRPFSYSRGGGVRVMVRPADLEQAREILAAAVELPLEEGE